MPDLWYVEELNPFGKWSACRYAGEKPTKRRASGHHRTFRADPRLVPPDLAHLTVAQLHECFSPDGKFRAMHWGSA